MATVIARLLRPHGIGLPLDLLDDAHGWSGELATHFAQNYRSGHVLNFVLAALAVLHRSCRLFAAGRQAGTGCDRVRAGIGHHPQHPVRRAPRMAPALARLSPTGRAAAAAAEPEAARHRRSRSAGQHRQPGRRGAGSNGMRPRSGGRAAVRRAGSRRSGAGARRSDRGARGRPAGRLSPGAQPPDHAARPSAGEDQCGGVLDDALRLGRNHRRAGLWRRNGSTGGTIG